MDTRINTRTLRAAHETLLFTDQELLLPSFIHKWSRQRRHYKRDEIRLPKWLYLRGQLPESHQPCISVGGTRSPSVEAFRLASQVVRELTKHNVTIVSGGVPGIDLAAHLAATEGCGTTYAVLANPTKLGFAGHEWQDSNLEKRIIERGGLISEYRSAVEVFSDEFLERLLQRDRIISGISDIFLAFECRENSATVDTARRAISQGKRVIAIDAKKKTIRVGIDQLHDELGVPVLCSNENGVSIARRVLSALGVT